MRNKDLFKTLDKMDDEERTGFFKQLRQSRQTYKENSKKPAAKRTKKAKNKVMDLYDQLTPEERAELIKELEE